MILRPVRPLALAALSLGALMLLSACSSGGAFVDRRREAGTGKLTYVGKSTPDAPSICYNSWTTSPQEVVALAAQVCAEKQEVPQLVGQTVFDCRLFYPSRANFRCVAGPDTPVPAPKAP